MGKRNPQILQMEGDALEKSGERFGDRVERGRIEKSCRRPRRIGADERKEFGEWECHDLFFHYNGNAVRDGGEGWIETNSLHTAIGWKPWNFYIGSRRSRYNPKVIERRIRSTRSMEISKFRSSHFFTEIFPRRSKRKGRDRRFFSSWHTSEYAHRRSPIMEIQIPCVIFFPPSNRSSRWFESFEPRDRVACKVFWFTRKRKRKNR